MKTRERIILFINRSASGKSKYRHLFAFIAFLFFSTTVILFILASIRIDRILELPKLLSEPVSIIISMPVMAFGILSILWCIFHFLGARGTPVPLLPPKELITRGPYAYSRNPMTAGLIIFTFGLGFYLHSISLTFFFVPLLFLLNYIELKMVEEPELEMRLGSAYIAYKKKVPMFFPLFRKSKKEN